VTSDRRCAAARPSEQRYAYKLRGTCRCCDYWSSVICVAFEAIGSAALIGAVGIWMISHGA
jgi:hypothetical protein